MKKGWLGILPILLINFVSAFSHYGYNRFSITGFFESINPDDLIFITVFMIVFVLVNFSLGRVFKDSYGNPNKPVTGVISLSVAILAAYSLFKTGFDLSGLFYNIGISEDILFFTLPIILLVAAVIIIFTLNFAALFLIFGSLMILTTIFTDLIYEKGFALVIGFVLLLIGLFWWKKSRKKLYDLGGGIRDRYDWQREKEKSKWGILVFGILVTILGIITGNIWAILGGLAVAGIGLIVWLKKHPWGIKTKSWTKDRLRGNVTQQPQQTQPPQERVQQRNIGNLKKEYEALVKDNAKLFKRNNNQIPARGTRDGERRHKNFQRMKQIEGLLRR